MTFEEFARARLHALLRFSTVLTNDRALGEDLVQDVMLRVHGKWGQISELDEPFTYVRRMLINEFISWRRKWARMVPRSDVAELIGVTALPDPADRQAGRAALADKLAGLPRKQRAVIVLRYYEDLPDEDIAKLLGCSPATVRVHALRGLRALRVQHSAAAEWAPVKGKP